MSRFIPFVLSVLVCLASVILAMALSVSGVAADVSELFNFYAHTLGTSFCYRAICDHLSSAGSGNEPDNRTRARNRNVVPAACEPVPACEPPRLVEWDSVAGLEL